MICVRADWGGSAALDNGLVIEVEPGRFEDMVVTALDGLPEELGQLMRNVAVTVEHRPGPPRLLGLYQGVPLTSRTSQYAGVLPDRITTTAVICAIATTSRRSPSGPPPRHPRVAHHFAIDDNRSANSAGSTSIDHHSAIAEIVRSFSWIRNGRETGKMIRDGEL